MSSFISCQSDCSSEPAYTPPTSPRETSYSAEEWGPGGLPSPTPSQEDLTGIADQMQQTRLGTPSGSKRKSADRKASNARRQALRADPDREKRASRPQYSLEENHAITYLRDDVGLDWRQTQAKHNIFFKNAKGPGIDSSTGTNRSISGLQSRYYRIHGAETEEEREELRLRAPRPELGLIQGTTARYWWMYCDSEEQYKNLPLAGSSRGEDQMLSYRTKQLKQSCPRLKNKSREPSLKRKHSIKGEIKMEVEPYRPSSSRSQNIEHSFASSSLSFASSPTTATPSSSIHMKISFLCD